MSKPTELELPAEVLSALGEGRQAHVAVESRHGPHVTPELFAFAGDRLWFAAAAGTVKANVLGKEGRAAAVVSVPGRSVLLRGDVEVFDPKAIATLARRPTNGLAALRALTSYTTRNAPDLLAFGGDLLSGKLGRHLPPRRVLFGLTPEAAALVEDSGVRGSWGDWDCPVGLADATTAVGVAAVAAFEGPIAVPGRWDADGEQLHVLAALLDLTGASDHEVPIGVVVDEYNAPGPAAKTGTLLRGKGRRTGPSTVLVSVDATVTWDGVDIESEAT